MPEDDLELVYLTLEDALELDAAIIDTLPPKAAQQRPPAEHLVELIRPNFETAGAAELAKVCRRS